MAGPFLGINMASGALRNFQRALDTSGHNLANVNTRGYSRQVVEFSPLPSLRLFSNGFKSLGQGAFVSSVNRVRDLYLDNSFNNSSSQHSRYLAWSTGLGRIESAFQEPSDTGVSAALDQFFNSWSGLASNPADQAARAQVQLSGQTLAQRIRNRHSDLRTMEARSQTEIQASVRQIDQLASQIASLNRQIQQSLASNGSPNDLLDQRDLALSDLSKIVNVTKEQFPDGSYAVYAAGFTLVQGNASRPFPTTYDPVAGTFTDGAITYNLRGGALSGQLATLTEVRNQMAGLDDLANTLRTQFNTIHRTGTDALGNTNVNFFNDVTVPPQTGAIDFDLSPEVRASDRAIAAGMTNALGDGSIAQALAALRDSAQASLSGRTFNGFFTDAMARLANAANFASAAQDTEAAVLAQVENQRQAISGVSIDDEMANLMRFQRSYQAAARAFSVFDQVTEDLIGMLRR